jgi:hypothetical protein
MKISCMCTIKAKWVHDIRNKYWHVADGENIVFRGRGWGLFRPDYIPLLSKEKVIIGCPLAWLIEHFFKQFTEARHLAFWDFLSTNSGYLTAVIFCFFSSHIISWSFFYMSAGPSNTFLGDLTFASIHLSACPYVCMSLCLPVIRFT